MRLSPNLHDLYVGRVVLVTVLLVWSVLVGLDVINAISSELNDLGKGSYSFGHAVAFVAYTIPRRAYTMFPTAAVIGALMGLGQLAASSELIALRAVGLSRRRLSLSVAITLALLTGLMVLCMETVGSWGQTQADRVRTSAITNNAAAATYSGTCAPSSRTTTSPQPAARARPPRALAGGRPVLRPRAPQRSALRRRPALRPRRDFVFRKARFSP
jgi:lipopolysaccharide export system permease protein